MSDKYKDLLNELKKEEKEYKNAYKNIQTIFDELDNSKMKALQNIEESVRLLESIKKVPIIYSYTPNIKKIKHDISFRSKEIEENKRKKELIGRYTTITGLFASGTVFYSFRNFFKDYCKGKRINEWLLASISVVAILILYLFYKKINKRVACKELKDNIYKLRNEKEKLLNEIQISSMNIDIIEDYSNKFSNLLASLQHCVGNSYKDITPEDKQLLQDLINKTKIYLGILQKT